jgi:hypothetical protein
MGVQIIVIKIDQMVLARPGICRAILKLPMFVLRQADRDLSLLVV